MTPDADRPASAGTDFHPVQNRYSPDHLPVAVTLRAYEVYKAVFGTQEAMITGHCRGGFGIGEIIAFLYAHTFPKEEWSKRIDEALERKRNP